MRPKDPLSRPLKAYRDNLAVWRAQLSQGFHQGPRWRVSQVPPCGDNLWPFSLQRRSLVSEIMFLQLIKSFYNNRFFQSVFFKHVSRILKPHVVNLRLLTMEVHASAIFE